MFGSTNTEKMPEKSGNVVLFLASVTVRSTILCVAEPLAGHGKMAIVSLRDNCAILPE